MRKLGKLRLDSLTRRKIFTYLSYAAGEVVLIMFGILVALAISNWSDESKLHTEERNLLKNLKEEFASNQLNLKEIQEHNQYVYHSSVELQHLVGKSKNELITVNVDSLLSVSILINDYRPNSYVFSQLKSTTQMELINSPELKRLLYNWEQALNYKEEVFTMWNTYFMQEYIPFLDANTSIRNIDAYQKNEYWATKSPLPNDETRLFQMMEFDNKLENIIWCCHEFGMALESLDKIASDISQELERDK